MELSPFIEKMRRGFERALDRIFKEKPHLPTVIAPDAGIAELYLISDEAIDERHLRLVRQLFGVGTIDGEIEFTSERRSCRWPLRVTYFTGKVDRLSFHVSLCVGFLTQRRKVIDEIHALGCNLHLNFVIPELTRQFSLSSSAMKQLSDLWVQFSLTPQTSHVNQAPTAASSPT